MKIQIFNNAKGLIYGSDIHRIECDTAGTLSIGGTEVRISPGVEAILPTLVNGSSGVHDATFTSELGIVYELARVTIRRGRIVPPSQIDIDMVELRCRVESLEAENVALNEKIRELSNIFDTNSLNFLIT